MPSASIDDKENMDQEAIGFAGEQYGVWTCDEYAETGSSFNQFHFFGDFRQQPRGDSGTGQVIIQPRDDGFYVQVILNRGDYDSIDWFGYIEQGSFGLIPK
jgi:hypothetical protein